MMFASEVWLEKAFKQKDISRWLAHQLSEFVGPPNCVAAPGWKCDPECKWANMKMLTYGDACIKCWLKVAEEACAKKEDA